MVTNTQTLVWKPGKHTWILQLKCKFLGKAKHTFLPQSPFRILPELREAGAEMQWPLGSPVLLLFSGPCLVWAGWGPHTRAMPRSQPHQYPSHVVVTIMPWPQPHHSHTHATAFHVSVPVVIYPLPAQTARSCGIPVRNSLPVFSCCSQGLQRRKEGKKRK